MPLEKATVLIAILAVSDDWLSREQVMALLWSEADLETTQRRLRQLLHRTRRFDCFAGLEVERSRLRFTADSDVALFKRFYQQQFWIEAAQVYQGEFLKGLVIDDPELETWLLTERETLRQMFVQAVQMAVPLLEQHEAVALLRSAVKLEPLESDLVRLGLEHAQGHPSAAKQMFELHSTTLAQIAEQPEPELQQLLNSILEQSFAPPRLVPSSPDVLIGRHAELEQIEQWLVCGQRLITLLGIGGIGKTRLALEVAGRSQLPDGVIFVSLVAISNADEVVPEILKTLSIRVGEEPLLQLQQILKAKEMLLVLDNLEHVISANVQVVALLEACPKLQVLGTSREALNVMYEHLLEVKGLPEPDDLFPLEHQEASALFEREAKRNAVQFTWQEADLIAMQRIHRAVGGSPLGLRLAAGLRRVLPLEQIAVELEQNLAVLSTNPAADLPARHQSLEAAFRTSWGLLPATEQQVVARLALLKGHFSSDLAKHLTQTSHAVLLRLINKSLISKHDERLFIHEVIREYASAYLETAEKNLVLERLLEWAQGIALQTEEQINTPNELETMKSTQLEFDHLQVALNWSVETKPLMAASVVKRLMPFFMQRGYFDLASGWVTTILSSPELQNHSLFGWCLYVKAHFARVQSQFGQTQSLAEQLLQLKTISPELRIRGLQLLALCASERLAYPQAIEYSKAALEIAQQHQFHKLEASLHTEIGQDQTWSNLLEQAKISFDKAFSMYQTMGSRRGMAIVMMHQSIVFGRQNDLTTEQQWLLDALVHLEALEDVLNAGLILSFSATNATKRGDFAEARRFVDRGVELCQKHGLRFQLIYKLADYAYIEFAQQQFEQAALLLFCCQSLLKQSQADYDWVLSQEMLEIHLEPSRLATLERKAAFYSLEQALQMVHQPMSPALVQSQ